MNHISILGTGCLRDVFSFNRDKGGYEIDAFVQNGNPLSLVMASPLLKEPDERYDEIFSGQTKFYRRCARQDAEKNVFEYLMENRSDWLLLDFAELRWDLYVTDRGGGTYRHPKEIQQLQEEGYLEEFRLVPTASLGFEKICSGIDLFLARLLKIYPEDRIILADVRGAERMVNLNTGRSGYFEKDSVGKLNPLAYQVYAYAASRMSNCHCIPFPDNTPADFNHKWGRDPLHYVKEYYDYAFEAMDLITQGSCGRVEEREKIASLKEVYNAKITERYIDYDRNKIAALSKELATAKRFKGYEQFFKEILVKNKRDDLIRFFTDRDKPVAIWGLNENTKLFLELLGERKDKIAYIVHNSQKEDYLGIPLVAEQAELFPEADVLVITDLNCDGIRSRTMAMKQWNTILTYEDLVK